MIQLINIVMIVSFSLIITVSICIYICIVQLSLRNMYSSTLFHRHDFCDISVTVQLCCRISQLNTVYHYRYEGNCTELLVGAWSCHTREDSVQYTFFAGKYCTVCGSCRSYCRISQLASSLDYQEKPAENYIVNIDILI